MPRRASAPGTYEETSESNKERGEKSSISTSLKRASVLITHAMDSWTSFVPIMVQRQLTNQILEETEDLELEPYSLRAATLFADASGFTALTERLASRPDGAELLSTIMTNFLGRAIEIVHQHSGDIVKFAGDAISVPHTDGEA